MGSEKQDSTQAKLTSPGLDKCVEQVVKNYFKDLDGHEALDLYKLVISEVEKPLFASVLKNYNGNISRAAQALGLSRRTVHGRLKKHDLLS